MSDEDFIRQVFPEQKNYDAVVSGSWNGSNTILMTYLPDEEYDDFRAAHLLTEVKKNRYQIVEFDGEFGIGVYPNTSLIDTLICADFNDDKVKDILVIESGAYRCHIEFEEKDPETGEMETYYSSATCELCAYSLYTFQNGKVELLVADEDIDWGCDRTQIIAAMKTDLKNLKQ